MSYPPPNPHISDIWVRFARQLYSNTRSTEPDAVRAYFSQLKDQTLHQLDPDAGHASANEKTLYQYILESAAPGRTPNARWISKGVRDAVVRQVRSYYSIGHLSEDSIIDCLDKAVRAKHTYQQAQAPPRQQRGRGVRNRGPMRILLDEMQMSGAGLPGGCGRSRQEAVKRAFVGAVSGVYDVLEPRLRVGELTFDQLPEHERAWLQQRLPKEMGQDRTESKVSNCFNHAFTLVKEEREGSASRPSISEQLIVEYKTFESYYTQARKLVLGVYDLLSEILELERPKLDDIPGDIEVWLLQALLKPLGTAQPDPVMARACLYWAFRCTEKEREAGTAQPVESYYTKVRQLALDVYDLLREVLKLERPKFDDVPGHMQLWLQQKLLKQLGTTQPDPGLVCICFHWAFLCVEKERDESATQPRIPEQLREDYETFRTKSMMSIGGGVLFADKDG